MPRAGLHGRAGSRVQPKVPHLVRGGWGSYLQRACTSAVSAGCWIPPTRVHCAMGTHAAQLKSLRAGLHETWPCYRPLLLQRDALCCPHHHGWRGPLPLLPAVLQDVSWLNC